MTQAHPSETGTDTDVSAAPHSTRTKQIKPKREAPATSKSDLVLKKLRAAKGVSLQQLSEATGWQLHSVRGFLSATVRKKLGLNLVSDVGKDEVRRYRITDDAGKIS